MNSKTAKAIRRMARQELIEQPVNREIVAHPRRNTTAVNSPTSVRGFTRGLKKAYRQAMKAGPART